MPNDDGLRELAEAIAEARQRYGDDAAGLVRAAWSAGMKLGRDDALRIFGEALRAARAQGRL
jgi:hypothetical protein